MTKLKNSPKSYYSKIKKNAKKGDTNALFQLGYIYDNGSNQINCDYKKSFKYYHKAAVNGHPEAQCFTGIMYDFGDGVNINRKKAYKWYRRSALQNNPVAQFNIAKSYDKGSYLPENKSKAIKWYIKSAKNGYADAECNLGQKYEFGDDGLERNIDKALALYLSSAKKGCSESQYNLGAIFQEGLIVTKDIDKALYWFKRAASQGDENAKNYIYNIETYRELYPKLCAIANSNNVTKT
tara:strand:+ start:2750 stop:3463 length:714 start_codon:yes stop_codon:yes gene_type:complete